MQRRLMKILACPVDRHHPLRLIEFETKGEIIISGMLICDKCARFYPIIDEIPVMLPDELRKKEEDQAFLKKWEERIPDDFKPEAG